jgi:glycosyltransferase involved in cell wall biosynthesis
MVADPEFGEAGLGDPRLAGWGERCECRLRFSIVIPAYNEEAFIGVSLRSLLAQDFADPYEIIVVDNNSSDETARVAMAHGVVVVREERQGVCWARQRGTEMAAGEIIVSSDADTVYEVSWLSRIDQEFRKDSGRVAVVGPFRFADAPWWGQAWTSFLFGFVFVVSRLTRRVPYVAAANLAFRKKDWPGYNTHATQGGDELDLLRRLQARGRVAFIPDNPVLTSSRRLSKGFVYNAIVTVFFYYFLGYTLNRLTRRSVVGMAPAFRAPAARRKPRRWLQVTSFCIYAVIIMTFAGFLIRYVH